jgi:hypothetical protein
MTKTLASLKHNIEGKINHVEQESRARGIFNLDF